MNNKKFPFPLISTKRTLTTYRNDDVRQLTVSLRIQEIRGMAKTTVELRAHSLKGTALCSSRQILPGGTLGSV